MIDNVTGAPAADESIVIGGLRYTMRVGLLAQYEVSAMNLEPGSIWTVSPQEQRITSFAHVLKLFRAITAHNFVAAKKPIPTCEEWALMLDGEKPETLEELTQKTLQVVFPKLMALAATVKLQEPAPKQEPTLN